MGLPATHISTIRGFRPRAFPHLRIYLPTQLYHQTTVDHQTQRWTHFQISPSNQRNAHRTKSMANPQITDKTQNLSDLKPVPTKPRISTTNLA